MRELIRTIIRDEFPQLTGGALTTHKAQVVAVSDAPAGGEISDPNRPRYSVDLQWLNADGSVDESKPRLTGVPLPTPGATEEGGTFGFPARGAVVQLAFEGGDPSRPKIAQIFAEESTLPPVSEGETVTGTRAGVECRIDADGNHLRTTDVGIVDRAQTIEHEADDYRAAFGEEVVEVEGDATRTVGGSWIAKVLGALKWQVAEAVVIKTLDALKLTAAREVLIQSNKKAQVRAPKVYLGSDAVDVVAKVEELAAEMRALAAMVAAHGHPMIGSPPTTAAMATAVAAKAAVIEAEVKGVVS